MDETTDFGGIGSPSWRERCFDIGLEEYWPGMTECTEAIDALVRPHAAGPDATVGNFFAQSLGYDVVDRDVARPGVLDNLADLSFIVPEIVDRERPWCPVDVRDRIAETHIGLDRQDWTEELLLHHQHVVRHLLENPQRQLPAGFVGEVLVRGIDLQHLGAASMGIVHDTLNSLKVLFRNDRGVLPGSQPQARWRAD
jgi:hypothetical protein